MFASEKGHIDIIKILLAVPGIDINKKNKVRKEIIVEDLMICFTNDDNL